MKTEYLRTAKHSYMIVKETDFVFEQYEVQMILKNEISSLLNMQIMVGDGKVEYWYEVTGMQSLDKRFDMTPVDVRQLVFYLNSICDMKKQMEDFLLNDRNIDFSPSMVFYDRSSKRIRFCYVPGYAQNEPPGPEGFMESVLQKLDHTDSQAVQLAYEIYEQCAHSDFVVEDCQKCLCKYKENSMASIQTENAEYDEEIVRQEGCRQFEHGEELKWTDRQAAVLSEQNFAEYDDISEEKKSDVENKRKWKTWKRKKEKRRKRKEKESCPGNDYRNAWEEAYEKNCVSEPYMTHVYGDGDNPTVCFSENGLVQIWELSYQGNGIEQNFRMKKFPYFIGTDRTKNDGVLTANTVSRIHARFTKEMEELYLEDYNSTNGTYLNGKLIPMNTPTVVKKGDSIIFGTEEYILVDRRIPKC